MEGVIMGIVKLSKVRKIYPLGKHSVEALNNIDLDIEKWLPYNATIEYNSVLNKIAVAVHDRETTIYISDVMLDFTIGYRDDIGTDPLIAARPDGSFLYYRMIHNRSSAPADQMYTSSLNTLTVNQ